MSTRPDTSLQTYDALLQRCARGEQAAFRELYQLYNKAMYNICARMLGPGPEAEDALQEAFISAFKNFAQHRSEGSFGAWLKRIVINRCLDAIRKKNGFIVPLEDRHEPTEEINDEPAPGFSVDDIREGLLSLPDGYRVILSLYLFEDHTHRMIAEKLGISEGTSKSQYARARKKLLEIIQKKKPDHGR
jgi:RNA polymerase sigma-70 factor (ECF subfamily)